METNDEEKIKKLMKAAYPKVMGSPKDKVCPTEDTLASFAEGKLKGKKEEEIISHLAICNDCLDTVKFLRQAPSAEEVSVPLWLEKKACDLVSEKPKTWEIVVGQARAVLEVIRHTAEECWTLPRLEVIPAKMGLEPAYNYLLESQRNILGRTAMLSLKGEKSLKERFTKREWEDLLEKAIGSEKNLESFLMYSSSVEEFSKVFKEKAAAGLVIRPSVPPRPAISAAKDKILKSLKKRIPDGFVFIEHMGTYDVYLAIARREEKRPETFDVEIEIYDRSGKIAEEIEVSFLQGRKTIAKSVTRKQVRISKSLLPNKYSIKFKQKGLYLGQALLDLREAKPEQTGSWE